MSSELVSPMVRRSHSLVTHRSLKQNAAERAQTLKIGIQVRALPFISNKVTLGLYFLICEVKL